jgi:hypothetical protein
MTDFFSSWTRSWIDKAGTRRVKITKVETHVLLVPDYDSAACSLAQDDIVVIVHTDECVLGIGETDTNPCVAEAMIDARGTHNLAWARRDAAGEKTP